MDERPAKRLGPLTLLQTSRRFRLLVAVVIGLPALYVASIPLMVRIEFSIPGASNNRVFAAYIAPYLLVEGAAT